MSNGTMNRSLSTLSVDEIEEPGWSEIREQQGWDDFLAWCRDEENCTHE